MRDEGLGYVVGRPARNSISDVLASRRWRGGTAADMVLAPLLVSNAVRAEASFARTAQEAVGMDQKLQRVAPDDASGCKKSCRTLIAPGIIASACKTLILAKFSKKKIWAAETRVPRTQHTHSELLHRLA